MFSISRQNELFERIQSIGNPLVPIDTFHNYPGAIFRLPRIIGIRKQIMEAIRDHRVDKVVVLMSHVWTPFLAAAVKRANVKYAVVVHDLVPHPGDVTALANPWLMRDALLADEVITLSARVAEQIAVRFPVLAERTRVLFLPLFTAKIAKRARRFSGRPIGFLFFGRIMTYKGLPLFVEACEILRARGLDFRIAVAGEGPLQLLQPRLKALGAEVTNHWIEPKELEFILRRYDVMVAPNIQASQSGVIALAHSYGLPSIATPVGGTVEQIEHERSGLIASAVSATAIADAMQRILTEAGLLGRLRTGVQVTQNALSMTRFLEALQHKD